MNNILQFKRPSVLSKLTCTLNIEVVEDCGCWIVCTDWNGKVVMKEFWNWDKIYGEDK